jgi:hypothetical protein
MKKDAKITNIMKNAAVQGCSLNPGVVKVPEEFIIWNI